LVGRIELRHGGHRGGGSETSTAELNDATRADVRSEGVEDELRFLVAAKLYELGRVTSGRAAQLVGIDRVEFLERLGSYRISGFSYGTVEREEEISSARK